jgi:hypothetical protein
LKPIRPSAPPTSWPSFSRRNCICRTSSR